MGIPSGGFGDRNESWTPLWPTDWEHEKRLLWPDGRLRREWVGKPQEQGDSPGEQPSGEEPGQG